MPFSWKGFGMAKEFYTTGEISRIIGISEKTVQNYCCAASYL